MIIALSQHRPQIIRSQLLCFNPFRDHSRCSGLVRAEALRARGVPELQGGDLRPQAGAGQPLLPVPDREEGRQERFVSGNVLRFLGTELVTVV